MRNFKNHYNSVPEKGEKNDKPSLTVPDQVMSIPELLKRHARGLPLGSGVKTPIFDGEEDILQGVDFRKLDISERMDFINERTKEFTELKNKYASYEKEEAEKKRKKAEKQAQIEAEFDSRQLTIEDQIRAEKQAKKGKGSQDNLA